MRVVEHSTTIITAVLLGLVLYGSPSPAGAQWFNPRAQDWNMFGARSEQPHPSVVRVVVPEDAGTSSLGSGTLIAVSDTQGLVISNWHVVKDAKGPVEVVFPDGFRSPATVLKTDRDWDLAALAVWKPNAAPVPLAAHPPRPGEMLTIAGYGSGPYCSASGPCTQYLSPGVNLPYDIVELQAAARNGDSGGPIFNNRGELAGVLFGEGGGLTSGSHCGRVRWFVSSLLGTSSNPPPPSPSQDTTPPAMAPLPEQFAAIKPSVSPIESYADTLVPIVPPSPPRASSEWESQWTAVPTHREPAVSVAPASVQRPAWETSAVVEHHHDQLVSEPDDEPLPDSVQTEVTPRYVNPPKPAAPRSVNLDPSAPEQPLQPALMDFDWEIVTGTTPFEQAKSALAGVGIVAIAVQVIKRRMKASSPPPAPN